MTENTNRTETLELLADAIRAALGAEHEAGMATGRFISDLHTPEATLREKTDAADNNRAERSAEMWRLFYEVAGMAHTPEPMGF